MVDRVASVLLALVLVTASASAPFAHVHRQEGGHDTERPEHLQDHPQPDHDHGQRSHWHPVGGQTAGRPSSPVSGEHHHDSSVSLVTVGIEHPGVRVGITPALVEMREARVVSDPLEGWAPVASNAGPNPPPPRILAARAPPL